MYVVCNLKLHMIICIYIHAYIFKYICYTLLPTLHLLCFLHDYSRLIFWGKENCLSGSLWLIAYE